MSLRDEDLKLLYDIEHAAKLVLEFVAGKTEQDYQTNVLLRSAVERQFEIIGEATNRLSKANPVLAAQINHYPKIIAFRNQLIHGYDTTSDSVVWRIIHNDLPALRKDLLSIYDFEQDANE